MDAGVTYYWAVDELDGDNRYNGPVWSFTTFGGGGIKAEYFPNMTLSGEPVATQTRGPDRPLLGTGVIVDQYSDAVRRDGRRTWRS